MSNFESTADFILKYDLKSEEHSLRKFFTYEYYFLIHSPSLNPAKLRNDSKLSKNDAENYFSFPMIFSHSVVEALGDEKKTFITLREYVSGLLKIYTGNVNERLSFIFSMFNINEDEFIHKKDLELILNYTHIFFAKKNQTLLNVIIDNFFGEHSLFTESTFTSHIFKKNSDLFFLIMCIFFENQSFDRDILEFLESEGGDQEKTEKCRGSSSLERLDDKIMEIKPPSTEVIDYILENFKIDLSAFKKYSEYSGNDSKNYSSVSTSSRIDDINEDMMELKTFETDYFGTINFYIGDSFSKSYSIPKGTSQSFDKTYESIPNEPLPRGLSDAKIRHVSLKPAKKGYNSLNILTLPHSQKHYSSVLKVNLSKEFSRLNITDYESLSGIVESQVTQKTKISEHFVEEVVVLKNNKSKKYLLSLVRDFLVLFKSTPENQSSLRTLGEISKIKKIIPLKHLYISKVQDGISLNQNFYVKLILVSTVTFVREEFSFLFEYSNRVNELVKQITDQTKYVSINNEYSLVRAAKTNSRIKLMRHNTSNTYHFVKRVEKTFIDAEDFTCLNWERDIVKFLSNCPEAENIIKFERVIESVNGLYIIMENTPSITLKEFLKKKQGPLSSVVVREIARQMLNGLRLLHSYGIIHRDLKLDNILIDAKKNESIEIRIADFSFGKVMTPFSSTRESYGSLPFCSPEIILNLPYNHKADVWSLGIIVYYLEYDTLPFSIEDAKSDMEIVDAIINSKIKIPTKPIDEDDIYWEEKIESSNILNYFINSSLCKNISQRETSAKLFCIFSD